MSRFGYQRVPLTPAEFERVIDTSPALAMELQSHLIVSRDDERAFYLLPDADADAVLALLAEPAASRPLDVLDVMRELTDLALNSGGRRGEDEDDNEPAIKLYENAEKARVAVAELIEAAQVITGKHVISERFASGYGYVVNESDVDDLRAALANVGGAP